MKRCAISLALTAFAGSAWSQGQDYQAMTQAMEKAQAEAAQPGDDTLTCEQLEDQLVAVVQGPAFQAYVQSAGADAQERQAKIEQAKGRIAVQTFRIVMMALVPGAAAPGMASAYAEARAQGAGAMQNVRERMEQAQKMMPLMPKLMRGQRVIELATAKACAWAAQAGPMR